VIIIFRDCPPGQHPCPPIVIHIKPDANHPFGFDIIAVRAGPVLVGSKQGTFAVIMARPNQPKSIRDRFLLQIAEAPSGVFALRVFAPDGTTPAVWTPPWIFVAPVGFGRLQELTRTGWVDVKRVVIQNTLGITRTWVQTAGVYRWAK
jgi:hypothetical protein